MEQEFWALPFVLVLLSRVGFCVDFAEEMSFQMGSSPFSQIIQHSHNFCLSHQPLPLEFAIWWQQAAEPHFGSETLWHWALPLLSVPSAASSCMDGRVLACKWGPGLPAEAEIVEEHSRSGPLVQLQPIALGCLQRTLLLYSPVEAHPTCASGPWWLTCRTVNKGFCGTSATDICHSLQLLSTGEPIYVTN